MKRKARIYFSFRSPFSWLAMERLERLAPALAASTEFIPYWEPDPITAALLRSEGAAIHYGAMSKPKHLYILHDVKRLAQKSGLKVVWPVDVDPVWEVPHLAWIKARQYGQAPAFYQAVVDARWKRGENICDPAVIRRVAGSLGLNGTQIAGAPEEEETRLEGVRCLVEAYKDDIFGVPYFRYGHHRFWGYDRLDDFLALAAQAEEASVPTPPAPAPMLATGASYDYDMPGGCG
jgi:2-hydroxychromene-2-carboxylate isomerase